MAPQEWRLPGTRPTERTATVDTTRVPQPRHHDHDEVLAAACAAMRLLQDRQQHTPEEMLDPRERKVLRQLRAAIQRAA